MGKETIYMTKEQFKDRAYIPPEYKGRIKILREPELVKVIRCKDCGYYHSKNLVCDRPFEAPVCRYPDDFCSKAAQRQEVADEKRYERTDT